MGDGALAYDPKPRSQYTFLSSGDSTKITPHPNNLLEDTLGFCAFEDCRYASKDADLPPSVGGRCDSLEPARSFKKLPRGEYFSTRTL